tara:strand:- start:787 stop:1932 length:1146 start_codon:yes stop_codon:yes gene_type:complete
MNNIEKLIRENCWRFPKGYPETKEDIDLLKSILEIQIQEQEEDDLTKLKSELIKTIQDANDLSDLEIKAYIKSIKNRGFKGDISIQLANKGYTADSFKFGDKALDKINADLDQADLSAYFSYLKNPKSLKDLKPSGKFHEELGLPKDLVNSFVDIEPGPDKGGSSIGKAELFLSLFFDDVGNTKDIEDPETGKIIKAKGDNQWEGIGNLEVKGYAGRLGQQAGRGVDLSPLFSRLIQDLLPPEKAEEFDFSNVMSTSISNLYKSAKENNVSENEIQDKIIKVLDNVYGNKGMAKNYFKVEKDFTDPIEITKNLLKLNAESYFKDKSVDSILFVDTRGGENKYVKAKKGDFNDLVDKKIVWTLTDRPTAYTWTNPNPSLKIL